MKVTGVETLVCDAGWRNYFFLKLSTDDPAVTGWSEYDEGFGSPGVGAVIEQLARRLVGYDVFQHERFFTEASCLTRPAPGSVIGQALGALENAMLDAKAKALGVPCYELLGGKLRGTVPVYWSHCPTWRINHPTHYGKRVTDLAGVTRAAAEATERGFKALKTNLFLHDEGDAYAWRPGFAVPFEPGLNVTPRLLRNIRAHLEALREGAGPDTEILIDLNFNAKPEGMLRILREIADLPLFWVEIDSTQPQALAHVRQHSAHPIASCETVFGVRGFLPYLQHQAIDVGIVDTVWNGVWQSMKIAAACDAYDVNVAPHNFYGDLCTLMNLHFAAAVPNLRVMEVDVDRLPWEHELYTHGPEIRNGELIVPDRPGWGTDPIEAAIRARPPKGSGGLLQYKRS
nr:mandelate racemase/muconate lactonizing enzyme family protein [Piscinibacter sakaiensis]